MEKIKIKYFLLFVLYDFINLVYRVDNYIDICIFLREIEI